ERTQWIEIVKRARQITFRPNIFADSDTDSVAAKIQRRDLAGRLKVAIFIENVVGREERFVSFLQRFSCLKQCGSVMKWFAAAFVAIDKTNQQCRFAQPFL